MENFFKEHWKTILILIAIFILFKVLNSLFGEGKGSKAGRKTTGSGVMDYNKYLPKVKKARKGESPISLPTKELGIISGNLIRYFTEEGHLNIVDVPEEKVIAEIKRAGTKGDIVVISKTYAVVSNRDLYADIKNALNDGEQKIIFDYINYLPDTIKIKK